MSEDRSLRGPQVHAQRDGMSEDRSLRGSRRAALPRRGGRTKGGQGTSDPARSRTQVHAQRDGMSGSEDRTSTVDVIGIDGETTGSVQLPGEVFDVPANLPLMHQVVTAQLAAARQGTHKTKTRGEVRGGGHKPWRQKGTGRARQGSRRAPQWKGGGVVHGPVPRDYSQRTPKKMKAAALRGALSDRAREGRLHVVEGFVTGDAPSTKAALKVLNGISEARRVLVVLGTDDQLNWLSLRNEPRVHLLESGQLNTYDVLRSDDVIFTTEALSEFAGVEPTAKPAAKKTATKKAAAKQTAAKKASAKAEPEAADEPTGDEEE